ncbi:MAG: tape measure protein [Bacteroidaceae bacterium]|nr:tape measure protein [Bacteroidaceae bacterium]
MATNIVDFLIKLKADATQAVRNVQNLDRRLTSLEQKAQNAGKALRNAFSLSNFNAAMMSVPGMQFLTNPYTMAAAAVGAVAKVGMEAEKTKTSFTTLLGSQEASKKMLDSIAKTDAKKVYGLGTIQDAAKTMLNFGVNSEDVLTRLNQLGDIAGGDAQKLSSLGVVFGQVTAAGKLSGQDLLQFINAGFNPLKELTEITGKSYAELQDMMSKGAISSDMVAAAMQRATSEGGQFYGMTQAQANTTGAKLQDMFSQIQEGALKLFEQLQPIINDVIGLAQQIIPPVMEVVGVVVGAIIKVVEFIIKWKDEIGLLLVVFGTFWGMLQAKALFLMGFAKIVTIVKTAIHTWTVVQRALNIALIANPIGIIISLVAALVVGVIYCWKKFAGFRAFIITMWDTLKDFGNILKDYVINRVNDLLSGIGDLGKAIGELFSGNFKGAWNTAVGAAKKISGVNAAQQAIASTKAVVGKFGDNYNKNLAAEQAKQAAKEAEDASKDSDISNPGLLGSGIIPGVVDPNSGKGDKGTKTGEQVVTGGKRNTSIQMTISKFFDNINVYMADKADTAELERVIVQSMNRALAIATSTDR